MGLIELVWKVRFLFKFDVFVFLGFGSTVGTVDFALFIYLFWILLYLLGRMESWGFFYCCWVCLVVLITYYAITVICETVNFGGYLTTSLFGVCVWLLHIHTHAQDIFVYVLW